MLKNFFNRILQYYYATNKKEVLFQSKLRQEIESIKKNEFKRDKKNLIPYGFKVFSQTDEDGIINEIFKRIGITNKKFLEFGVNASKNNTTFLLLNNWTGVWLEISTLKIIRIKNKYKIPLKNNSLRIYKKKITAKAIKVAIIKVIVRNGIKYFCLSLRISSIWIPLI